MEIKSYLFVLTDLYIIQVGRYVLLKKADIVSYNGRQWNSEVIYK